MFARMGDIYFTQMGFTNTRPLSGVSLKTTSHTTFTEAYISETRDATNTDIVIINGERTFGEGCNF